MFLAGPKVKNPLASKLASDFQPFDPGILNAVTLAGNLGQYIFYQAG